MHIFIRNIPTFGSNLSFCSMKCMSFSGAIKEVSGTSVIHSCPCSPHHSAIHWSCSFPATTRKVGTFSCICVSRKVYSCSFSARRMWRCTGVFWGTSFFISTSAHVGWARICENISRRDRDLLPEPCSASPSIISRNDVRDHDFVLFAIICNRFRNVVSRAHAIWI